MSGRQILELISEYVSAKGNAELHSDLIPADEAEAKLSKIATAFEAALLRR